MPGSSSKVNPVPLECIGIILSESAYRVNNGPNLVIANTFHLLLQEKFPCSFPKITAVYTVTGGHGTYDLELAIVSAATGDDVRTSKSRHTSTDPLALTDVLVVMRGVPFPAPGKYWSEVRCNGQLIGQRPFYVKLLRRKEGGRPDGGGTEGE
jgi:hypothetical protein